jgi:hypothetical protein
VYLFLFSFSYDWYEKTYPMVHTTFPKHLN